jgi:hypothetical protein
VRRTSASHLYATTDHVDGVMAHWGHNRIETTYHYLDTKIVAKKSGGATAARDRRQRG